METQTKTIELQKLFVYNIITCKTTGVIESYKQI